MKFIQKIFYIFISCFFIFLLYKFIYNKEIFYDTIINTIILWFKKILPAISISFIISMFLYNFPIISYLLYPILKPIFHFENQKACSLYLISIIVGNPTSTKLINKSIVNNEISISEGNRLFNYSSFVSTIFLYSILDINIFYIILLIELITSIILAQLKINLSIDHSTIDKKQSKILDVYFDIINILPSLLLSILVSMIICNILSLNIPNIYIKSLFEISNGIILLNQSSKNIFTFSLLIILTITHGLAILMQIYYNIGLNLLELIMMPYKCIFNISKSIDYNKNLKYVYQKQSFFYIFHLQLHIMANNMYLQLIY